MDELDIKILELLSENSDVTATEINKHIHLSIPAINKRIQQLKSRGIIKKFTVVTDEKKVGKPIIAYIFVVLQSADYMPSLIRYIEEDRDILECSSVTGEYDFILKVCTSTIEKLDEKLLYLKKNIGIVKSNTMLSLTGYKYSTVAFPNT